MTRYDDFIVAFYLVFILIVGAVFRRQSKNTSDYFRAGGAMPWWITGTSAWIAGFSAWTFTGAAGKVYETGTLVLCLYYANLLGLGIVFAYNCVRFRRLRVVTWMEAVRERFGAATEQFYTWLKLPMLVLLSGVGLNAVGVFMSSIFHVDIIPVLIVLGVVVTVVSVSGGAWAVLASDFIQMFLVVTITMVAAFLTLRLPQVGGLGGLLHKVPSSQFHWTQLERPDIIVLWIMVLLWNGLVAGNSIENATMYLMTKSDRDARRMVLIPLIGSLVGPLIWFIPSMAATFLHPNIAAEYPNLKVPQEAAFVAVCMQVLPKGLLGLLVCAMMGATLTSMDAGLNKGAGVFVRSFYLPRLDPQCSEKKLLVVSKICTVVFGVLIMAVAIKVSQMRTMGLFDLSNQLAASLLTPMAIPLVWGLFYKKTPSWSAWSTVLIGFAMAWLAKFCVSPQLFQHVMHWQRPLSTRESTDVLLGESTFLVVIVGSAWFFMTGLFYKASPSDYRARVDALFLNMNKPINLVSEIVNQEDRTIYRMMGALCLAFGSIVTALLLIPNDITGRLCFLFCGGVTVIAGVVLLRASGQKWRNLSDLPTDIPANDESDIDISMKESKKIAVV